MGFGNGKRPVLLVDRDDNVYLICNRNNMKSRSLKGAASFGAWGDLQIAAATAANKWSDWTVIFTPKGPFTGEPLLDRYRWRDEGILSVYIQQEPEQLGAASPLRVIDFNPVR